VVLFLPVKTSWAERNPYVRLTPTGNQVTDCVTGVSGRSQPTLRAHQEEVDEEKSHCEPESPREVSGRKVVESECEPQAAQGYGEEDVAVVGVLRGESTWDIGPEENH
jgi:hypothetical protein